MIQYDVSDGSLQADMSCDMSDAIRFSASECVENRRWNVRNGCLKGMFEELRGRDFNIVRSSVFASSDCCLHTRHAGSAFLSLGVVLKGNVEFTMRNRKYGWNASEANILIGSDYRDEYNRFRGGRAFEMLNLVVSASFFRLLAEQCADCFEPAYRRFLQGETFFWSENRRVGPMLGKCLQEMSLFRMCGNCGEMYLRSKVQEALSWFVGEESCRNGERTVRAGRALAGKIAEAREILVREYLNPPSLHELALRVGTNECTLKSGFKEQVGQSVFAWLLTYRMQLAASYLRDTDKSVADVAASVGYEYQSHFCVAFKKMFGMSPLQYRKAH